MSNILKTAEGFENFTEHFENRSNGPRPEAASETESDGGAEIFNEAEARESAGSENWIIEKIDQIIKSNESFHRDALEAIKNMEHSHSSDGSNAAKAKAVSELNASHSQITRRLLDTLDTYLKRGKKTAEKSKPFFEALKPHSDFQSETPISFMINGINSIDWSNIPEEIYDALSESLEGKSLDPAVFKKMTGEIKSVIWSGVPDNLVPVIAEQIRNAFM